MGLKFERLSNPLAFLRVKVSIFVNDGHENTKKVDKKVELEAAIEFRKINRYPLTSSKLMIRI